MINASNYKHLTSKVEQASNGSLVFYYIWSSDDLLKFQDRIKHHKEVTFVINQPVNFDSENSFIVLDSQSWREEKARLAAIFYPIKQNLIQFAITGTNGKTSTTFLGMQLSKSWNKKAMYIGTLGIYIDNQWVQTNHGFTTPDIIDYREKVSRYQDKVDIVWIEASSHGLEQGRLDGIEFDGVGWTSFSQDHLDYHETMEKYFEAKKKIFKQSKEISLLSEKINGLGDIKIADELEEYPRSPFLKIGYNQKNFNLAYSLLDQKLGSPCHKLDENYYVPGRFQTYHVNDRVFIVDYAHTPDALEKVIGECRKQWPSENLLTVVGCGGDRDKTKRPLMARIASDLSNRVIFTEDNPRGEAIDAILEDMTRELKTKNWSCIQDRREAIKSAISSNEHKVVVIAGKGEENQINRGHEKIDHSDFDFIESQF